MAKRYKISLTLISILIMFSFCILLSYKQYLQEIENTNPYVLVLEGLSINYLNGTKIEVDGEEKDFTFSITNNSETEKSYYIHLENMEANQEIITYLLKEQNNKVNMILSSVSKEQSSLATMLKIEPGESHFFTLNFKESEKLQLAAKLVVNVEDLKEEIFANTILKNNDIKTSSTTKFGSEVATENEGLISAKEDMGEFYYFRGNIENNYVSFAGLIWRIVRINSDGSVKLILNDYTSTNGNFYETNNETTIETKLNFSENKMHEILNEWYQKNLLNYESHLISNKFCVDDTILNYENGTNYYLANARLLRDYNENYNCLGTNYTTRIGLLSADEVVLAGASANSENTSFYLYVPDKTVAWWTLTPNYSVENNIAFFEINTNGMLSSDTRGTYYRGIRPVINLVKRTSVTGSGTIADPYIIKE